MVFVTSDCLRVRAGEWLWIIRPYFPCVFANFRGLSGCSNLFKGFTGLYLLSQSFFVDCDFLSSFASSRVSWTQNQGRVIVRNLLGGNGLSRGDGGS